MAKVMNELEEMFANVGTVNHDNLLMVRKMKTTMNLISLMMRI